MTVNVTVSASAGSAIVVVVVEVVVTGAKLTASRLSAVVLILVSFAPFKSFAGVKAFTDAIKVVRVDKHYLQSM